MLKLLEGLGKTANIAPATRFEEDESDEESEAADDD
jgi:hypothetical protein